IFHPCQLQFDFAALHISEPENNILHQLAARPFDMALTHQAILPAWLHSRYDAAVWNTCQIHLGSLQKWQDVELSLAHLIISTECVLVINFLHNASCKQYGNLSNGIDLCVTG
ncbi:hypothetical protein MUK42_08341, partial [Musa troglodytarum]